MHRAPSHSWEVTEEVQPFQLIYEGQTGYRFLYLCRRVGQGADLPWRFELAMWNKEWLNITGLSKNCGPERPWN